MIRRIWVLICSTRAFESPLVNAAWTISRCCVIRRASFRNGSRRDRPGPLQPRFEQCESVLGVDAVDLAQLLGEEVGAV